MVNMEFQLKFRGVARVFGAWGADFRLAPPTPPKNNLYLTKICEIA